MPIYSSEKRLDQKRSPYLGNKDLGLKLFHQPVTNAIVQSGGSETIGTFGSLTGTAKWFGGVLAPNGFIYGIPYNSTTVLKIDPSTDTATTFGSLTGTNKWFGGVLAPNGFIYVIPYN